MSITAALAVLRDLASMVAPIVRDSVRRPPLPPPPLIHPHTSHNLLYTYMYKLCLCMPVLVPVLSLFVKRAQCIRVV
jgi:hypothetical protein